jgi:hypothetical protein
MTKENKDPYKTGNRKCWHVLHKGAIYANHGTLAQARKQAASGSNFDYCRDGYKLVPCTGEAHSNPHIDNCSVCAPRWGLVMVKDSEG